MFKKILTLGAAAIISVAALSGCSSKSADATPSTSTSNTATSTSKEAAKESVNSKSADAVSLKGETDASKVDYLKDVYLRIVKDYHDKIANSTYSSEDYTIGDGEIAIAMCTSAYAPDEALKHIGFSVVDLNNDGVDELIIGTSDKDEFVNNSNQIYALYTCVDNAPKLVFEGWDRNRFYLTNDNSFYNEGSIGALYTSFYTAKLLPGESELSDYDTYFSAPDEIKTEAVYFYHGTTASMEPADAKKLSVSDEEFSKYRDDFEKNTISYELKPLSDFSE